MALLGGSSSILTITVQISECTKKKKEHNCQNIIKAVKWVKKINKTVPSFLVDVSLEEIKYKSSVFV